MNALVSLASAFTVSLMGVFARQNRKEGWVKKRKYFIDSLRQARRDLLTPPEGGVETTSAVAYAGLPVDPTEFTGQLSRLQSSLHRANQPVLDSGGASVHEAGKSEKKKVFA